MGAHTLGKTERVKSQKLIDSLFARNASSLVCKGFRFSWVLETNLPAPCAVMFISSKKKLPHATQRNRRKRLLRELYRLNKQSLLAFLTANQLQLALSINYVGIEELQFHKHQTDFQKAIQRLIGELQKHHTISIHPAH